MKTTGETIKEHKFEVDATKYREFQDWQKKAIGEYENYELDVPAELIENVPESLRAEVLTSAKNEIINLEKAKAKELLVNLNSPFKEKKIAEIKVNTHNFLRQKAFNQERLANMKRLNTNYIKEDDKTIKQFEVEFLIEKLDVELNLLKEQAEVYSLDWDEVTKL